MQRYGVKSWLLYPCLNRRAVRAWDRGEEARANWYLYHQAERRANRWIKERA